MRDRREVLGMSKDESRLINDRTGDGGGVLLGQPAC